ncbi:hypothetical protein D6853_06390 [Butyrivibrio sp. X503]|uniref:hypothetical protein n=1 Tax=Butyrivibrio sp. X503 TaxID=2364878 RepID=UPI000EA8E229|nr:hypothetical protein [Butyrivibrio sp. X503]RKM56411.1 hypothetical protein D6853_06390 [Butyrivibrio sp. X503]
MRETTQITYGDGIVSVELISESKSDIPAPVIRFGDYEKVLESCFTRKELEEIYEGDHASLTFSFVMSDSPEEIEEYDTLVSAVSRASKNFGELSEGIALEVNAVKSVDAGEELTIDNLLGNVELQIEIPLYLIRENREYYLMTDSFGACTLYEDYDNEADTLSVNTNTVGTSMLIYRDTYPGVPVAETSSFGVKPQFIFGGIVIILLVFWNYVTGARKQRLKEQR